MRAVLLTACTLGRQHSNRQPIPRPPEPLHLCLQLALLVLKQRLVDGVGLWREAGEVECVASCAALQRSASTAPIMRANKDARNSMPTTAATAGAAAPAAAHLGREVLLEHALPKHVEGKDVAAGGGRMGRGRSSVVVKRARDSHGQRHAGQPCALFHSAYIPHSAHSPGPPGTCRPCIFVPGTAAAARR